MELPQIIILNGCSSSGKTSLAKALQEKLPQQYLNFSIDAVLYALPGSDLAAMQRGEPIQRRGHDFGQLVRAYHYALPGLLQAGCHLILDNAWCERAEKRELLTELAGYRIALIGVHCDLDELNRREQARGDRAIGMAAWEFERVHQELTYDFEIDTTGISPETIADMVFDEIHRDRIWHGAIDSLEHLNMLG
ncbi:AAA family ATPase [Chitinibacter bivalviorum]|uniref:AAA family ATPase n=1 Tax=Chitinibacter bivalviorum TaxID=2739434 RepID=A0A7H9BPC7_9NEIS|nr:AAA family ATPase [Chitinibacter bivalviorum]QLG89194.1 AAA family ATPase [Chitinibacter bivalviorum]